MKNVLVFPAGSEIGMEINNALKYSTHFKVFGLTSADNHAEYVFSECLRISEFYNEPGFLDALNRIIADHDIDYLYPADDDVQLFLVENAEKVDAVLVSAGLRTTAVCRSKMKTYQAFAGENFIPQTYASAESVKEYPVFVKPDVGQGAEGALKISDRAELEFALREAPGRIICEYLCGEEYTVDCFTGRDGRLLDVKMRNRGRIRIGISVHSELLPLDPQAAHIAEILNASLEFIGAWFFQVKRNQEGQLRLLEAAPRIAGSMGLTRNTGTNYPLLTLFTFEGETVEMIRNQYRIAVDRAFVSRYKTDIQYDTIYVDFDDTVVMRGSVNAFLMMFLYQAKNDGKAIILLSRHRWDIEESLAQYCIDRRLFDDIRVLKPEEKKSMHITADHAVFIDDSFAERQDVSAVHGIPVFDCSEVEALVDWRVRA